MSASNAGPGVRSPDGRWYWDGRQWVPTGGPAPARPPAPGPAPRKRGGALKYVLLALGLIVLLVVIAVGGVLGLILHNQGVIEVPFLPPTARTIMQKPLHGTLHDAKVQMEIKDHEDGSVQRYGGTITFAPRIAMSVTPQGGERNAGPQIVTGGVEYGRVSGRQWFASPEEGNSNLGFLQWSLTDPEPGALGKIAGTESLPGGTAWHVRDWTGYYDWWIRKSDGYPLKAFNHRANVDATYTFSDFNAGSRIDPPGDTSTNVVRGQMGQSVDVPGVAEVKIDQVQDPVGGGFIGKGVAAHGYRNLAIHITYTYRGSRPGVVFPGSFPVADSRGFVGQPTNGSQAPAPQFPENSSVMPGTTLSGWVAVQVRDNATGLAVMAGSGGPSGGFAVIPIGKS
jgi:hypothetical protein